MCRPEREQCILNKTNIPYPRTGHTAIIYRTWTYEICTRFVEIERCDKELRSNLPCSVCLANQDVRDDRARKAIEKTTKNEKGISDWLTPLHEDCPAECCGALDEECERYLGNYGEVINTDEEIMLVYGGLTQRYRTFEVLSAQQ